VILHRSLCGCLGITAPSSFLGQRNAIIWAAMMGDHYQERVGCRIKAILNAVWQERKVV